MYYKVNRNILQPKEKKKIYIQLIIAIYEVQFLIHLSILTAQSPAPVSQKRGGQILNEWSAHFDVIHAHK